MKMLKNLSSCLMAVMLAASIACMPLVAFGETVTPNVTQGSAVVSDWDNDNYCMDFTGTLSAREVAQRLSAVNAYVLTSVAERPSISSVSSARAASAASWAVSPSLATAMMFTLILPSSVAATSIASTS